MRQGNSINSHQDLWLSPSDSETNVKSAVMNIKSETEASSPKRHPPSVTWSSKYLKLENNEVASSNKDRHYAILRNLSFATASFGFAYFAYQVISGEYETFAYPLLITATLCTLLHVSGPRLVNDKLSYRIPSTISYIISSTILFFRRLKASTHTALLVILVAILPTLGYGYHKFSKRLEEHSFFYKDAEFQKHLANNFGKISVMAMSFFLIPVSRHSIMLQAARIDPIQATSLHIWAGYLALWGALVHGAYYVFIWIALEQENLWRKILPPLDCWSHLSEYDKFCHKTVVNFLGVFALLSFLILTASSLHWVRRRHYHIFYYCHIIFGCFLTVALLMHYRKVILYISPSICYYFASAIPTLIQGWIQGWYGGAAIASVKSLVNSGNCTQVSVRVDRRWVTDQRSNVVARHVRVCVPSLSHLWHPFSVFSPPHQRDRLNFIFRSYGPFTQSFAERLSAIALGDEDEAGCSTEKYPLILVDGIYDIPDRMRQALDHDIVCIVAGGIGIVSYLDMLLQLHSMQTTGQLKKVVLHWVCRDEGLIEHVAETHFRKLDRGEQEASRSSWMDVQIVIHHTSSEGRGLDDDEEEEDMGRTEQPAALALVDRPSSEGIPLIPSFLSRVYGQSFLDNVASCIIFSLISWGCWSIILTFYDKYSNKKEILYHRSYVFFALVVYAMVASTCILVLVQWLRGSDESITEQGQEVYSGQESDSPQSSVIASEGSAFDSIDCLSSGTTSDLELTENNLSSDDCEKDPHVHVSGANTTIDIAHLKGRPVIGKLLNESLHFSDKLGVFVCGPEGLLKAVKDEAESSHLCSGKCAVYEELFEV